MDEGERLAQRRLAVRPEVHGEAAACVTAGEAAQLVQLGFGQPATTNSSC